MKFLVTLDLRNEDNYKEIANFEVEGDYQKKLIDLFEKQERIEICLNGISMGKYRIIAYTAKIEGM